MSELGFSGWDDYRSIKNMKMVIEDLTHKIIGCAKRVHSVLGSGFQEVNYQRAMTIEMEKQGLISLMHIYLNLFYNRKLIYEKYKILR